MTIAFARVLPYVRQSGPPDAATRRQDPAMIQKLWLTSTRRLGPIFIGFLGAVRLGTSESAVYTAGGRAP